MMPTADEVAVAIVAAARETGASPIEIAEGARGNRHHPEVLRGRAYAAIALRAMFVDIDTKLIARMVGVWTPATAYSYLKTLDEQRSRGFLDWWDDAAFETVVSALQKAHSAGLSAPRKVAPTPRPPVPQKPLARPVAPLATPSNGTATFEGLDRVAAGFGRPKDHEAGGDKQLIGRAEERRKLGDILAEAVRNTARLQDKIKET